MMFLVALFISIGIATAQTQVSGTVISSEDNEPIIGASVIVEGSKTGAVTDQNGNFTLSVPKGKKIVASYIGMRPQTLSPKPTMKITLSPNNETLTEVVVTGVSNMDRRMFTGAADKIKANDALISGMADISRSLEGRSAGVSVQNVSVQRLRYTCAEPPLSMGTQSHCGLLTALYRKTLPTLVPTHCRREMPKRLSLRPLPASTQTTSRASRY